MNQTRSSSSLQALVTSVRRRRRKRRAMPGAEPLSSAPLACEDSKTMPRSAARVLGPYPNGVKWRLVLVDGQQRKALVADSYESALQLKKDLQGRMQAQATRSCGEAVDEYLEMLAASGIRTTDKVRIMLRQFLPLDEPIAALSAPRAEQLYLAETQRKKSNGQTIAADTHHLLLRRAKQFYKWAVSRRYLEHNPFSGVRPVGRPRRGKPQLRIDEARRFVAVALKQARELDVVATAALLEIFLGLRPTEAMVRIVRDLDDEGRVLWIPFGKTSNARRRLQVPEVLREVLLLHIAGKPADAPLLGPLGEPMHTRHALWYGLKELCRAADVPQVCPHSLRGLNATLALEAGATAHHVAAALGHASFTTTARHYVEANTLANASLRKVADLLTSQSSQTLEMQPLVSLLRAHLSKEQLRVLVEQLNGQ